MKYRLELFAAGLVENPQFSCSLEEGRRQVKKYVDVWENLDAIKKHNYNPNLGYTYFGDLFPVGRGLLAGLSFDSIFFFRVPHTTTGRQEIEEWKVDNPSTQYRLITIVVYSPENILAIVGYLSP